MQAAFNSRLLPGPLFGRRYAVFRKGCVAHSVGLALSRAACLFSCHHLYFPWNIMNQLITPPFLPWLTVCYKGSTSWDGERYGSLFLTKCILAVPRRRSVHCNQNAPFPTGAQTRASGMEMEKYQLQCLLRRSLNHQLYCASVYLIIVTRI